MSDPIQGVFRGSTPSVRDDHQRTTTRRARLRHDQDRVSARVKHADRPGCGALGCTQADTGGQSDEKCEKDDQGAGRQAPRS